MRAGWALVGVVLVTVGCRRKTPEPGLSPASSAGGAALASAFLGAPSPGTPERVQLALQVMGAPLRFEAFTTAAMDEERILSAMKRAKEEILRVDALTSSELATSDVGRLHAADGKPVTVSSETVEILEKARWASQLSRGKVDLRQVALDAERRTVTLGKGVRLDLDGIRAGYALELAVRTLRASGVTTFLAQLGSTLYGSGVRVDNSEWAVGIQDPRGPAGDYFAALDLQDRALSTTTRASGVVSAARREGPCRSVSIVARDTFTASALGDVVCALGEKAGLALVATLPDVGAILVDRNDKLWLSDDLKNTVRLLHQPKHGK